jgi:hypothetical protein
MPFNQGPEGGLVVSREEPFQEFSVCHLHDPPWVDFPDDGKWTTPDPWPSALLLSGRPEPVVLDLHRAA